MTDPRVCTRSGTPCAHAVRAAKHTWADAPVTSRVAQMEWVCGSTNKMLCPSTPLFVSPVPMSQQFPRWSDPTSLLFVASSRFKLVAPRRILLMRDSTKEWTCSRKEGRFQIVWKVSNSSSNSFGCTSANPSSSNVVEGEAEADDEYEPAYPRREFPNPEIEVSSQVPG